MDKLDRITAGILPAFLSRQERDQKAVRSGQLNGQHWSWQRSSYVMLASFSITNTFLICHKHRKRFCSPLDPLEDFLLVFLAHEKAAAPGCVDVQPDAVLLTDVCRHHFQNRKSLDRLLKIERFIDCFHISLSQWQLCPGQPLVPSFVCSWNVWDWSGMFVFQSEERSGESLSVSLYGGGELWLQFKAGPRNSNRPSCGDIHPSAVSPPRCPQHNLLQTQLQVWSPLDWDLISPPDALWNYLKPW